MAYQSVQLVMRAGPNPGKTIPIEKSEIFIGRDIANDVLINDAEVSRRHARISIQAGNYVIEDLGSTNGTFVNGQKLAGPRVLRVGDTVMFGENVSLTFEMTAYDPNATLISAASPVEPMAPEEVKPQRRTWLWVGCGCLVVLLCVVVVGVVVFDQLNMYCSDPFRSVTLMFGGICP